MNIRRIGPYRLHEEIGSGGMGRVFRAEQSEPVQRELAVKLLHVGLQSPGAPARFDAERRALARLNHPNIVRIFDGGTADDDRPYLVMELVDGTPLLDYCERREFSIEQKIRLFLGACAGVQHAHLRQVVHRDISPANLLVEEIDGEPQIKIIDFGVAKALGVDLRGGDLREQISSDDAATTVIETTAPYASPEILDRGRTVDLRTDVFSLGMALHELLTGRLPFASEMNTPERLLRLRDGVPRPGLEGDLDWILLRAVAFDPQDRYSSAAELADDLERALRGDRVHAGPASLRRRVRQVVRKHRAATIAATVALLALLASVAAMSYGLLRARQETKAAQQAWEQEAQSRREAEEIARFLNDLFNASGGVAAQGDELTAHELLLRGRERIRDELQDQPQVHAEILAALAQAARKLGLEKEASELEEERQAAISSRESVCCCRSKTSPLGGM